MSVTNRRNIEISYISLLDRNLKPRAENCTKHTKHTNTSGFCRSCQPQSHCFSTPFFGANEWSQHCIVRTVQVLFTVTSNLDYQGVAYPTMKNTMSWSIGTFLLSSVFQNVKPTNFIREWCIASGFECWRLRQSHRLGASYCKVQIRKENRSLDCVLLSWFEITEWVISNLYFLVEIFLVYAIHTLSKVWTSASAPATDKIKPLNASGAVEACTSAYY